MAGAGNRSGAGRSKRARQTINGDEAAKASVAAGRKAKEKYKLQQSKMRYKNNILKQGIPIYYNRPGGPSPAL